MTGFAIKLLTKFVTSKLLEKVVIALLEVMVKRTTTDIDDAILKAVLKKTGK